MKNQKRTLRLFSILFIVAFASPVFSSEAKPSTAITGLQISFKLDARLSGPTYGGEHWVSPPTYVGAGAQNVVEARVQGVDANGRPAKISPKWLAADTEMIEVSPSEGPEVKITVKRAGESKVQVSAQGVSKELNIKAVSKNNVMQVEIAQQEPTKAEVAPKGESALKSQREKLSYALGVVVGNDLRNKAVEVDLGLLNQGIKDGISGGKMILTEDEMRGVLLDVQAELKRKQSALQAEKVLADNALAEKNKKEGQEFLASNKAKEGVVTLESGLQYKILKAGDGKKPTLDDTVVCHYRGTLLDGKEFDSSYKRKEPAVFPLKKVIKGWSEALQLMPVGSKWEIFVPPSLAYSERGARGGIGPNATLIFEVELMSIKDDAAGNAHVSDTNIASTPSH